jgi:hypothetical protein
MREYTLLSFDAAGLDRSLILDQSGMVVYTIKGNISQAGGRLQLFGNDNDNDSLLQITRLSTGLLSRFVLQSGNTTLGSIGLTLNLRELLFVNGLNWLITGSARTNQYSVHHLQHLIMLAKPQQDLRQKLVIWDEHHVAELVLIAAFLDKWLRNTAKTRRSFLSVQGQLEIASIFFSAR